jgi:hypothetical protein
MEQQSIFLLDTVSKNVREFGEVTADQLSSLDVRGTFLSVSDGSQEFIWSII